MTSNSILRRIEYLFNKSFDLKTQVLIRVALIGIAVGVVGVAFRVGTEKVTDFLVHNSASREHWYDSLWLPIICTLGGLFASYITVKYAKDAAGSGIPQVKVALNQMGVIIKLRTIIVKFFGAMAGIASGLSLGREGPTIHIGAGLGSTLAKATGGKHPKRAMASGAGAGLAAAFNTPIAGVLFVIEELDRDFSSVSLGPAIVGSVSAAVTCRLLYGDFFLFHFQSDSGMNMNALPFYVILGILAGVFGIYFQRSIVWGLDFYKNNLRSIPAWAFGAVAGLITGLVGIWIPEALGGGHTTLEGTLAQAYVWWFIPVIFLAKYLLTVVAYGSGVPGGIFAPSLVLGALMGATLGNILDMAFPYLDIHPASFAFVGMGAFFTGISRAPITSIVMLFELTGNYDLVLPLMFACIIANITAERAQKGSIYENLLEREGVELKKYSSPSYLQRFSVAEAMITNVDTIKEGTKLSELHNLFEESDHTGFPVVNQDNGLVGIVTKHDLHDAFDKRIDRSHPVSEIMSSHLKLLTPKDSLHTTILLLYEHKIGRLIVVDPHDSSKIVGLITRSDIINFEAHKELDL